MLTLVCVQLAYMRMMVSGCGGNVRIWSRNVDNFDGSDRSEVCRGLIMLHPLLLYHTYICILPTSNPGLHPPLSAISPGISVLPGAFKMFWIHASRLLIDGICDAWAIHW